MLTAGAPMSAAMFEDVYQMGVETVIVFGTCIVLATMINWKKKNVLLQLMITQR